MAEPSPPRSGARTFTKVGAFLVGILALVRFAIGWASGAGIGEMCLEGDDCRSGTCLQVGVVGGYCSEACSGDDDCEGEMRCTPVEGQRYCVKAPSRELGEPCTVSEECITGVCVGHPLSFDRHCTRGCGFASPEPCPEGWACVNDACVDPAWLRDSAAR